MSKIVDPIALRVLRTYQEELQESIRDPERLARVYGSYFMTRPVDDQLTAICQTATQLTQTPAAILVLLTEHEAVAIASYGHQGASSGEIDESYCQHHIMTQGHEPIAIVDSTATNLICDLRATVEGGIRSYLGVPLIKDGYVIGTLCVYDFKPRNWSKAHTDLLTRLAAQAMQLEAAEAVIAASPSQGSPVARGLQAHRGPSPDGGDPSAS